MNQRLSPSLYSLIPLGLVTRDDSPQEHKSAKMRRKILDATLDCLAKHGYSKTTISLVCEIGKISRGAMLHHYPSRQELMQAATEYAFFLHLTEFIDQIHLLTDEERIKTNSGIAIDWQMCQSRAAQAYTELRVAARTDKELSKTFIPRALQHGQVWREELLVVFPEWREDIHKLELAHRFIRAFLEGLTLLKDQWHDPETEWILIGFMAKISAKIRANELKFPTPEEVELLKEHGLAKRSKRKKDAAAARRE